MTGASSSTLAPTLWRTSRALANRRRLRILHYLLKHPQRTVSDVARDLRIPATIASEYLRALNARGLLHAGRFGRWVFYRVQADASVPQAAPLLQAVAAACRRGAGFADELFLALTGFTHARRIVVVKTLTAGPLDFNVLRDRTGISSQALLRHLKKLIRRGYVVKRRGQYHLGRPPSRFGRALLKLAQASS